MNKDHLAIFERPLKPADNFSAEKVEWEEVVKEWVSLEQLSGREQVYAQQMQALTTHKATAQHSPTLARVTTACRMKIAKPNVVDESQPNSDVNFRIFGIETIVNVKEQNRELQFMVQEKI